MLGAFAEFGTKLCKERQMEGIAKAKAAGVCSGRKPSIDVAQVHAMQGRARRDGYCQGVRHRWAKCLQSARRPVAHDATSQR